MEKDFNNSLLNQCICKGFSHCTSTRKVVIVGWPTHPKTNVKVPSPRKSFHPGHPRTAAYTALLATAHCREGPVAAQYMNSWYWFIRSFVQSTNISWIYIYIQRTKHWKYSTLQTCRPSPDLCPFCRWENKLKRCPTLTKGHLLASDEARTQSQCSSHSMLSPPSKGGNE